MDRSPGDPCWETFTTCMGVLIELGIDCCPPSARPATSAAPPSTVGCFHGPPPAPLPEGHSRSGHGGSVARQLMVYPIGSYVGLTPASAIGHWHNLLHWRYQRGQQAAAPVGSDPGRNSMR